MMVTPSYARKSISSCHCAWLNSTPSKRFPRIRCGTPGTSIFWNTGISDRPSSLFRLLWHEHVPAISPGMQLKYISVRKPRSGFRSPALPCKSSGRMPRNCRFIFPILFYCAKRFHNRRNRQTWTSSFRMTLFPLARSVTNRRADGAVCIHSQSTSCFIIESSACCIKRY